MADIDRRHLDGGGAEIIGEGTGEEMAALVVSKFLEQRGAETMDEAAVNLALDDLGIELGADVMNRHVFVDAQRTAFRVDFDRGEVDDKAEGRSRGDTIVIAGRAKNSRRHDRSFDQAGRTAFR